MTKESKDDLKFFGKWLGLAAIVLTATYYLLKYTV
jgi:hypothetical protein